MCIQGRRQRLFDWSWKRKQPLGGKTTYRRRVFTQNEVGGNVRLQLPNADVDFCSALSEEVREKEAQHAGAGKSAAAAGFERDILKAAHSFGSFWMRIRKPSPSPDRRCLVAP